MGGEGSMMAANNSLKNNRSLLSKRREKNALSGSYSKLELKDFPDSTPEALELIKQKIKREKRQTLIKTILVFIFTLSLFSFFIMYKNNF